MVRTIPLNLPLDDTSLHHQLPDALCTHTPKCPTADSADREAAAVVASHPEQGWSLLCNGVLAFEDTGDLLPDGRILAPHRPTDVPVVGVDDLFVAYMKAFEASNGHWAACPACQEDRPCEVGGPIHDRFAQLQDRYEATKHGLATT